MSHFRPKEVLHRAQQLEGNGQKGEAANEYALLCVYLRKKKRWSDALKMVEKAINLRPDSGRLNLEKSLVLTAMDRENESFLCIERAVQIGLDKKQLEVYLRILEKDPMTSPAVRRRFLESWIELDRTSPTPFLSLANFAELEENWQEAKKNYLTALRIAPEAEAILESLESLLIKTASESEVKALHRFKNKELDLNSLMLLLGGKPLSREKGEQQIVDPPQSLKNLSELVEELEKELELDTEEKFEDVEPLIQEFRRKSNQVIGSDLQARLDLASAFFEMGRLKEAKAELSLVEPEHLLFGQAQHLLGIILIKEGSDIAALGAFQTALRGAAVDTVFWKETMYQLIKLHVKLLDFKTASSLAAKLQKADSNYRDLKKLQEELRTKMNP